MALTGEETIYNLALGYIGEYVVTEGLTTQKQYQFCERYYDQARDEVLVEHPWNEAMVSIIIAAEEDAPLFGYSNKFSKPSALLRVISVDDSAGACVSLNRSGVYPWETEGDYILADGGETPQTWATDTKYLDGEFVSTTPTTYAGSTSYAVGQFVKSGTKTYQVLTTGTTSGTAETDVTSGILDTGVVTSTGTYEVTPASGTSYISDTVANDLSAGNITAVGPGRTIVYVTYVQQLTDTTKYSPRLKQAIAMKLAVKVVTGLTNDTAGRDRLINEFERLTMPKARSVDGMQGKPHPIFSSGWIRSRSEGTWGWYGS